MPERLQAEQIQRRAHVAPPAGRAGTRQSRAFLYAFLSECYLLQQELLHGNFATDSPGASARRRFTEDYSDRHRTENAISTEKPAGHVSSCLLHAWEFVSAVRVYVWERKAKGYLVHESRPQVFLRDRLEAERTSLPVALTRLQLLGSDGTTRRGFGSKNFKILENARQAEN